jgi:hypothetical protein
MREKKKGRGRKPSGFANNSFPGQRTSEVYGEEQIGGTGGDEANLGS